MIELCRSVVFIPTLYNGTVDSILARPTCRTAALRALRTILVRADPCWDRLEAPGGPPVVLSLVGAMAGGDSSHHVGFFVGSARTLSEQLGWLYPPLAG